MWQLIKETPKSIEVIYSGLEPTEHCEKLLKDSQYKVNYTPSQAEQILTKESIKALSNTDITHLLKESAKYPYYFYQEFISSLSHYIKSLGVEGFIEEFSNEETIEEYKQYGRLNFCYFIALLEYLHQKHDIEKPLALQKYLGIGMEKIIFEEGDIISYTEFEDPDSAKDSLKHSLDIFLKYNLIITEEVFDIV